MTSLKNRLKKIYSNPTLLEEYEKILNITQSQYYYPVLSLYYHIDNDKIDRRLMKFQTRYYISKLLSKNEAIVNNKKTNIFIKSNPIVEPLAYIRGEYLQLSTSYYLSFFYNTLTIHKINNVDNSSYIDAFCSLLCSTLVENKKCPSFEYCIAYS